MSLARWIGLFLLLILPSVVLFVWLDSYGATKSLLLSDKIIVYSSQGAFWYTSNSDGGLRRTGVVEHGIKISALLNGEPNAMDFRFKQDRPLTVVLVPYWSIMVVALLPMLLFPWRKLGKRHYYGRCPNCHYDLRSSPHKCPECGTPIGRGGRAA
jgi:hypothetical protein